MNNYFLYFSFNFILITSLYFFLIYLFVCNIKSLLIIKDFILFMLFFITDSIALCLIIDMFIYNYYTILKGMIISIIPIILFLISKNKIYKNL